jgi:[amino group carrier protein]-L-2-aminoadipate 6-kinase
VSAGEGLLVVKVGGSAGVDMGAVCADVATLWHAGRQLVLLHGGSAETDRLSTALGHPPRVVTSPSGYTSRYTDRATLEIFEMVYCGSVNKGIVERLQGLAVPAVGLSGLDGRIFEGRRKATVRSVQGDKTVLLRDDHTGTVERVNDHLLDLLLGGGYLPVLTPPGASYDGEAVNVDGDRAAAAVASALRARALVVLSNVPGLLAEFPDERSLVPFVPAERAMAGQEVALGRMRKKVLGAAEAVQMGVGRVVLADGRIPGPITAALAGRGTVIARDPAPAHRQEQP